MTVVKVKCPKCKSLEVDVEEYLGTTCVVCKACSYDECATLEVYPQFKGKKSNVVYRSGGPKGKR